MLRCEFGCPLTVDVCALQRSEIDQLMRTSKDKHCSYDYDEINLISTKNSEFLRQKAVIDDIVSLERCACVRNAAVM
jgi:hypothetical protein